MNAEKFIGKFVVITDKETGIIIKEKSKWIFSNGEIIIEVTAEDAWEDEVEKRWD